MISVIGAVMTCVGFVTFIVTVIRTIWVFRISNVMYIGTVKVRVCETESEMLEAEEYFIPDVYEIGEQEYAQYNLFKPDNAIIKKMSLQEIPCNSDIQEKSNRRTIHVFHDVTPEKPACVSVARAETIPQYVLTWKTDYGAEAEYDFSYNGFNERYNRNSIKYKMGFWAKIRKVIGLK